MQLYLLVVLAAGAVPAVTAGPDLVEQARELEAPIERVTVFSDRALVRRAARVQLAPGTSAWRLPDLPGAVLRDSVRVECRGAKVLRLETTPVERERFTIDQVDKLLERIEQLADQVAALDGQRQVYDAELTLLDAFRPGPPVAEKERLGRPIQLLPDTWKRVLDFLERRRLQVLETRRGLDRQRRKLTEKLEAARREARRFDLGGMSQRKLQVVVMLQADKSATARLALDYFVPGAAWRPSYDLEFQPEQGRVILRSAGQVEQASGEDWNDVELVLSTAMPGAGLKLPELLTWTLGEKREFVPRVRPARMPPEARLHPPPVPGPTPTEAEQQARREVLRQRIAELQRMVNQPLEQTLQVHANRAGLLGRLAAGGGAGSGAPVRDVFSRRSRAQGAKAAPPPAPPRPMAAAPAAAPMEMVEMEEAAPRPARARYARRRPRKKARRRQARAGRGLELFEAAYHPPRLSDPSLPAVLAAGLDYRWRSATRVSVPSTGKRIKVPLAAESFRVETFYEATPALKDKAYLKALVRNKRRYPILAGPMNIFVAGDFTGQGRLRTTGPGGTLELALGADEDIRFKRQVVPSSETKGVFSKDDVTTYTVTIEVGNYKKRRVKVVVYDVLPRSGHEKVEIEKVKTTPPPGSGPDADGVLRWDLDLRPGATAKVVLVYRISRPHDWQLYQ